MNVLHIISGGETGGSKKHLLTLSMDLAKKGVKNIIICLMKGALYDEAGDLGLDIRLVEQPRRFDMGIVPLIQRICEDEMIDIINCHGGRANFIAWFLRRRCRAKYVTTVHSDYRDDYRGNFYKTLVYSNINRFSLKSFDGYITVSHSFRDMLKDRGFNEKRIFTVYNGIDFTKPRESFSRESIIKKYSLGDHMQYVTMVARLHPVKGHSVFLEACKDMLLQRPDTGIILAGDGDLKEELKKYTIDSNMEDNVYFVGHQRPDEFIYISDFTALASYTESFPMVLLESAFYEKTAVATDVGGIPMLIEEGVNGYLVPPGDSVSLSQKMLLLLSDKDKAQEFGKRLHERASSNFSSKRMAQDYIDIYKRILAGGIKDE